MLYSDFLHRQCVGLEAASCNLFNISDGCNDPETYATERDNSKVEVTCQSALHKRDGRSESLVDLFDSINLHW